MNYKFTKARLGELKKASVAFAIASALTLSSTRSQTPSNSNEGRWVSYAQLNEYAKYVAYKPYADSLLILKDSIIASQARSIADLTEINNRYEKSVLPTLQSQVANLQDQLQARDKLAIIREEEFKAEKDRIRRKRIGIGPYAGYGATPQNMQPSIGIAITYTLIRF